MPDNCKCYRFNKIYQALSVGDNCYDEVRSCQQQQVGLCFGSGVFQLKTGYSWIRFQLEQIWRNFLKTPLTYPEPKSGQLQPASDCICVVLDTLVGMPHFLHISSLLVDLQVLRLIICSQSNEKSAFTGEKYILPMNSYSIINYFQICLPIETIQTKTQRNTKSKQQGSLTKAFGCIIVLLCFLPNKALDEMSAYLLHNFLKNDIFICSLQCSAYKSSSLSIIYGFSSVFLPL